MTRTATTLVAATLVVLAGCAGGLAPGDGGAASNGTVSFWVSDERNAIDQFEHLNVTITTVGFVPAEGETATPTNVSGVDGSGDGTPAMGDADADRVTYDVDDRTVDLTELQGENATKLADLDVPEGTYAGVFVRVSEVEGTLASGEQVNVKLPSETLRLAVPLTVESDGSVDYVFDITVHEAGSSGMYILRPVVGESGPDVPIRDVDRPDEAGNVSDSGPPEDAGESDDPENASDGGPPEDAGNATVVDEQAALDGVLVGGAT